MSGNIQASRWPAIATGMVVGLWHANFMPPQPATLASKMIFLDPGVLLTFVAVGLVAYKTANFVKELFISRGPLLPH